MTRHIWTPKQIEALTAHYPDMKSDDLAQRIGVTVKQLHRKANRLGIKKSIAFLSSNLSGRLHSGQGAATRFKPGNPAWNKGMKGLNIGGKETRFKKGHRGGKAAENYQPTGAERISNDGYIQRKVNDDLPMQKRWRGVHLINWEAQNGPLPEGHTICFKDGNRKNVALENLELVSRADLMRRNTYHNYGPDIAKLVQLKGAITRQIHKLERKSE